MLWFRSLTWMLVTSILFSWNNFVCCQQTCQEEYIGGTLWNRNVIAQLAYKSCSSFHESFCSGVYITRMCHFDGEWGYIDYSSCTMGIDATPFVMVEITGSTDISVPATVNQVIQSIERLNYDISRVKHESYSLSSSTIVVVFVDLNNISVSENIISDIRSNALFGNQEITVNGFHPSCHCPCANFMNNAMNYVCIGPSITPCTLQFDGSYQCTRPMYAGNGARCGLDSDNNGQPDVQLDCIDESCEQLYQCRDTYNMHNRDICSQRGNTQIEPSGITIETLSHIVVVLQGQQVMLECTPTPGYLPIEWKFNDAEIERDDVTFSPLDLQHTLTIDSVEYDDSGEYTCFVPGNFIAPINQTITLDVLSGAPSIIGLSDSQLVAIESQLTLICNASGFPTPAVEWRINGTVYNRDFVHMQLIDRIVIETLTVDSVVWSDAGFYECVATNSLGVVVGNTTINVEDKNCPEEVDSVWGIEWQRTLSGSQSMQNCPGMSSGHAYRWCLQNATWDTFINTTLCQNTQLVELNERVNNLKTLLSNNTNQTVTEVETVSEALIMITDASMGSITPNDVNRSIEIIDVITRITHDASSKETTNDTIRSLNSTLNNVATTIDNLLSDSNRVSFQESQNSQLPTLGEDLLRSIENFAIAVGEVATTEASFNNLTNMRKAIPNDNIFVEALLPADNEEMIETIVFPDDNVVTKINGVKITIPASAIIQQRHSENAKVPVVNFITNNLQSYINDPNLSEQSNNMSSGVIISTKFSEGPIDLSNEARVMLTFNNLDISENDTVTTECVFWDFNLVRENDQTRGGWSSEGIIQDDDDTLPVLCYATHLTSFSVLIKPSGNTRAIKESGLHIVSYVGCGISIVSLLLNIAAIIVLRRNSLKSKHNIVHLNLSIALLIGLILFVSGIENSTGSEGTCLVVAILLHYFFLAVFCWMLCEGIIILVMFFALFYKGIFQRLFFFMIIGWGLPIPIVAVSAGLSHNNYGIKDSDGSLTACWISEEDGAIWAFTAPLAVILLINLFILIISLVKVYHTRKQKANMSKAHMSQHNAAKTLLVSVLALLPLLGGTWILGMLFLVDSDSVVVAWIFTIVNSMQGFAIFYFHVVRNKEVKAEIQEKFTNWRKERMLRSSMKSSFMKSSAKESTLSRQDSTVQSSGPLSRASSRYDKNKHSYVSSSKGYSSSTVAVDPIIVETDDQATLADKDVLQNSTV